MLTPKALHYTKNHLWLRPVGFSEYFIGITDLAQKQMGLIRSISLNLQGVIIEKNALLGHIEGHSKTLSLISPIGGKIIAVNSLLGSCPSDINNDPYMNWILRIAVEKHMSISAFLNHEEYQELSNDF